MYTYDADSKKIMFGETALTGKEVLSHLNKMLEALVTVQYAWGVISDGVEVLDGVFLGAATTPDVDETAVEQVVDDISDGSGLRETS